MSRALVLAAVLAAGFAAAEPSPAAEAPSVSARLDPDHLAAGDLTLLQISINGSVRIKGAPDLALQNLQVVTGPSLENRFEWINGRSSSQTILVYRLRALKPGPASVGPIRVSDSSGRTLEAPQLTATVERSPERPGETRSTPVGSDPALVARLDPPRPYAGQQAVWTLYLVTRGRATQGEIKALPDFKGFWAEDLDREPNVTPQPWSVGGEVWRAYPMVRKALFPNRPGDIPIGPARAILAIHSDIFDIFGDSPFSDSRPVDRESPPLSASCRPVPADAARLPVGTFSLKASVDRASVPPGGSFTVTAALSGDGRVADVAAPALELPGARVSEPEAKLSIRRGALRLLATRTWQWAVTPERAGDLTIPPLRIPTFNPGSGRVVQAESSPLPVHAAGPLPPPPSAVANPRPAAAPGRPSSAPSLIVPVGAAVAILLLAIGYRLGRSRGAGLARGPLDGPPERRVEEILDALAARARARGTAAQSEVARLRGEFARAAFSPQISSRDEALERLEAEARRLARRWRVRL